MIASSSVRSGSISIRDSYPTLSCWVVKSRPFTVAITVLSPSFSWIIRLMPSRYASSGDTFSKSSVNMGSTAVGTDWVPRVSVDVGAGVGVPAALGVGESVGVGTPVGSGAWEGAGVLAGAGAWSEQAESVSVAARAARYRSFRILRLLFRVSRVLIGSLGSYRVRGQYATCWKLIYPTASVPSGVHCLVGVAEDTPGGQPSVPPWVL